MTSAMEPGPIRVVVLGGAGNFGARIVRALQDDPAMELIAASRRGTAVPGAANVRIARVDIDAVDLQAQLARLSPGLVIHCVGPFQGQDYRVAAASLRVGAHYLDLADGREFVAGFSDAMSEIAAKAGRTAISGASTLPGLSFAVVESLRQPLTRLQSVEIAIAPGQRAPRGTATLAAVFSYLGRPFPVLRAGAWQKGWGWMDLHRIRFAFGRRWGALCDVPDLQLLPIRYPELSDARFDAALEIGAQHLVLWCLAALRRLGLPLPMERWAAGLNRAAGWLEPIGGQWSGMRVSVVGATLAGTCLRRTWQLTAPALHGPEIPCMAAILLARRIARGAALGPGAGPCIGQLQLADFTPEFERWDMRTHIDEAAA